MNFTLKGYKTYLSATMVVLSGLLFWAKIIDQTSFISLVTIFSGMTAMGFRSAKK